ncbi:Bet v1-like protein [Rhizoclosmatium globosum]|uniref:Bet v1-like protein n=1 Tax=Rhizoclosmatium globosum TaxID=329046 RepID=A0A1Y2CUH6_9FUNG|nr:Bet v1-like protein [Rhizoclosmatium globosum]|eukprot:ORY49965.1 Bet v1-like protein [Rhizoclosmatium globosum]
MTNSNPHAEALTAAFNYLKTLEAATDFVYATDKNGAKVYSKPTTDDKPTNMPIGKGVARIAKPFTLEQVMATIRDEKGRKQWDSRFEGMEIKDMFDGDSAEVLVHSLQFGQWPVVSGRDFCITAKNVKESDDKGYVVFTSVQDPKIPEVKGRVRAHIYCVGWVIEKAKEGEGSSWDLTYFTHVDPKGLPNAIVAVVANETPSCAGTLVAYLEKNGPVEGA